VAWTTAVTAGLLAGAAACASGPPDFSVERADRDANTAAVASPSRTMASIDVGVPASPPPGDYRVVRLYEDGRAEVQEVFTVNGPGPWLTYEGVVEIAPGAAREILQAADAVRRAPSTPPEAGAPCILAQASTTGSWQGCADSALARRVLSAVPRLAPAEQAPRCAGQVCEVRFVRATRGEARHRYGRITGDIVFDASGAFSCATAPRPPKPRGEGGSPPDDDGSSNVLRVERGQVRRADASALFAWLTAGIHGTKARGPTTSHALAASGVLVRGDGADWTALATTQATVVTMRWARMAVRLPPACRQ
jgi:hypothetical protein